MFKFKSKYSETGTATICGNRVNFKDWKYETESKEEAEDLRSNLCFVEVLEKSKVEVPKTPVEGDVSIGDLKREATELGIPFGGNIGVVALQKKINDFKAQTPVEGE